MKTLCIDFNGVCDTYTGWIAGGDGTEYGPREGLLEFLQEVSKQYEIIVLTAIKPHIVMQWFQRYDLDSYIHSVTNVKPSAVVYIDDRAIRFDGDFKDVLIQLHEFKPHWQKGN